MLRSQFEKNPIIDPWSKMIIITGRPGNRSDMVAGWLSNTNHERFLPLTWWVNPVWGNSSIPHFWEWGKLRPEEEGDPTIDGVKSIIRDIFRDEHSSDARWVITKSHYTSAVLSKVIPEELSDHFLIIDIVANDLKSRVQIEWEAFVKNVLRVLSFNDPTDVKAILDTLKNTAGDASGIEEKTDLDFVKMPYQRILDMINSKTFPRAWMYDSSAQSSLIQVASVEYQDLMTSNGPVILSDILNLSLKNFNWDTSLTVAAGRDRYWAAGQWWERPLCE